MTPWPARCWAVGASAMLLLLGCGGGSSTVTTVTGGGLTGSGQGPELVLAEPSGDNTLEVVVDSGPQEAFALGVANVPYVTVLVCRPGEPARCTSVDHVLLDTGSVGLRVLRSAVAALDLPPATAVADAGGPAVAAVECYPFVLGGLWGPVVRADVGLGGERARQLPVQLIDDSTPAQHTPPQDCVDAADGSLLTSVTRLQAKGVLGIGMVAYDCGADCVHPQVADRFVQYYACDAAGCRSARMGVADQVQNPVAHLGVNNNGSLLVLPALPALGAAKVTGRLVLGIGTQANNQLPVDARVVPVDVRPASPTYLFVNSTVQGQAYPYSYIDSGSNGLFFDDTGLSRQCAASNGGLSPWYCPASVQTRQAQLGNDPADTAPVSFQVASADLLFSTSNVAFANLAGWAGQDAGTWVWGLPFFYGRKVYTSIWGQALSLNGPWWAF